MLDFRKFLQREPEENPVTEVRASAHSTTEIVEEYRSILIDQLIRGGVSPDCVEIEVKQTGKLRDGRIVYTGMLRLVKWDRARSVRLLLGLPILESRLRPVVRGSWVHEVSAFGGVWLHASGQLQDSDAMEDLRSIVIELERRGATDSKPPSSGSIWSLPTDHAQLRE